MRLLNIEPIFGDRIQILMMVSLLIGVCFNNFSIEANAQLNVGLNWLEICNMSVADVLIAQPCRTLISPDGYTLNPEGVNVLGCLSAPVLSLIVGD